MPDKALGHLRVLELCRLVCGPYCTKLLADLGAEVIKVEPPGSGDEARRRGPYLKDAPDAELSGLFLYLNTNKLGITLDVGTSTGRKVLRELIAQADVFVEDNPPAFMEELGLTYNEVRAINPRLVMTSITPFGRTGPYRDYRAHELNVYHAGGEGYMMPIESPYPDREPVKGGGLVGDCMCGLSAALATLAAVYRARATGQGQQVDVSRQDVLMTMVGLEVAMYAYSGMVRTRHHRKTLMAVPLECRDGGYIMVSAFADRDWQNMARFMGRAAWAEDERFSNIVGRWVHAEELMPAVEEWAAGYEKEDLFHRLQALSIAAAPVNTPEDVVKSPQMQARGFLTEMDHARAGRLKYPAPSYRFSQTPCSTDRGAPLLGQHNELVYCEKLGYSRDDLVGMAEAGVI